MLTNVGFSGLFWTSYIWTFWYFDVSIWSGEKIRVDHQQTPTDTDRPLKQHLAVSLAVCCCWLMSGDVLRCMWGVWGCLRVCEWYLWMSDSHLCWFWFWWVVFVGYTWCEFHSSPTSPSRCFTDKWKKYTQYLTFFYKEKYLAQNLGHFAPSKKGLIKIGSQIASQ